MNETDYQEAITEIYQSYDAFYIENKYTEDGGTHKKEFDVLIEFVKNDERALRIINWIKHHYDCYYKIEADNSIEFYYLRNFIKEGRK